MKLFHFLAALAAATAGLVADAAIDCSAYSNIDSGCCTPVQALFIVDHSLSIANSSLTKAYNFIRDFRCGFQEDLLQTGIITFNRELHYPVPLATYDLASWETAVNGVNKGKSKFTPMAEAFFLAQQAFKQATDAISPPSKQNACKTAIRRIAFVVTDGNPAQNVDPINNITGFEPFPVDWLAWKGNTGVVERTTSYYLERTVPRQAKLLKDLDVHLVFLGMDTAVAKTMTPKYFTGEIVASRLCTTVSGLCGTYGYTVAQRPYSQCIASRKLNGDWNTVVNNCMLRDPADPEMAQIFPIASSADDVYDQVADMTVANILALTIPKVCPTTCFV